MNYLKTKKNRNIKSITVPALLFLNTNKTNIKSVLQDEKSKNDITKYAKTVDD